MKIEAEKGFRRTLFEPELVGPNLEINFVNGEEAVTVLLLALKKVGDRLACCKNNSFTLDSIEREKA